VEARDFALRAASPADFDLLWRLQCEAMRPNVERQFGAWDEAFQRELFEANTDPTLQEIIEFASGPIGCQWVRTQPTTLQLVRLQILPAWQGQGIGADLVERLKKRAQIERLPVRLQVFRTNPARRLYARLGFTTVERTDSHEVMVWVG